MIPSTFLPAREEVMVTVWLRPIKGLSGLGVRHQRMLVHQTLHEQAPPHIASGSDIRVHIEESGEARYFVIRERSRDEGAEIIAEIAFR